MNRSKEIKGKTTPIVTISLSVTCTLVVLLLACQLNSTDSDEIKGSLASSFTERPCGGSFYMYSVKLTGAGSVIILPGSKQGKSHYL